MNLSFRTANTHLQALGFALALTLTACGGGSSADDAAGGSLTIEPSLGLIRDADVILRQLSTGQVLGTLNTGSSGSVTFDRLAADLGAYVAEIRQTANSQYYDEALNGYAPFTGSLHVAGIYEGTATIGATALTEAAYRRASALAATLTAEAITQANEEISEQFGLRITDAARVVGSASELSQLQANAADAYALVLAAIAQAAADSLGAGEAAPALAAMNALAADAVDGKIDGIAPTGTLPLTLPYFIDSGVSYAQSLQGFIDALVTSLGLPAAIAQQITLPTTPVTPTDPVDPTDPTDPVDPPVTGAITASGSVTTGYTAVPDFTPKSDGFQIKVGAEGVEYTLRNASGQQLTLNTGIDGTVNKVSTYVNSEFLLCVNSQAAITNRPCAGVTVTSNPTANSVSIQFTGTKMAAGTNPTQLGTLGDKATFNGTITGIVPGAAALKIADLPRSNDGIVIVDGAYHAVRSTTDSTNTIKVPAGLYTKSDITLYTDSGNFLIQRSWITPSAGGATTQNTLAVTYATTTGALGADSAYLCKNCDATMTVTQGADTKFRSVAIDGAIFDNQGTLADITLGKSTIFIGATTGTFASSEGAFTPVRSFVSSTDTQVSYSFYGDDTAISGNTVTMVVVDIVQGALSKVTVGGTNQYICMAQAEPLLGYPACGGTFTLGTDKRTLTLSNINLSSGKFVGGNATFTINSATLTNHGL